MDMSRPAILILRLLLNGNNKAGWIFSMFIGKRLFSSLLCFDNVLFLFDTKQLLKPDFSFVVFFGNNVFRLQLIIVTHETVTVEQSNKNKPKATAK